MKALWFALLLCAVSTCGETPTREDTQWITDLGGTVARNPQGLVTAISLRGTWVTDTNLRRLTRYSALSVLDLSLTHITDGGMQEIKNLRGVTDFNLYFAEYVTDEGVAAIKDWKRLNRLNLHGTKAGDSALEHIAGLTLLESLDVGSTLMTDVGLERLTSWASLITVWRLARRVVNSSRRTALVESRMPKVIETVKNSTAMPGAIMPNTTPIVVRKYPSNSTAGPSISNNRK
jgi:hypothetical protein